MTGIKLVEKSDCLYLEITLDKVWAQQQRQVVTTALLGKAKIPDLPYEQPDGTVLIESPPKKNGGTYTFTVTDVVKSGQTYNASLNVETFDTIVAP